VLRIQLDLRHKRTKRQTDRHQKSNSVHFNREMWHLVACILMIFLIINWRNFAYLLVDHGVLSSRPPPKFLWSIALRPPIGWTPLTDTKDNRTNKRVSLFVSQMEFDKYYCPRCHVRSPAEWVTRGVTLFRRRSVYGDRVTTTWGAMFPGRSWTPVDRVPPSTANPPLWFRRLSVVLRSRVRHFAVKAARRLLTTAATVCDQKSMCFEPVPHVW